MEENSTIQNDGVVVVRRGVVEAVCGRCSRDDVRIRSDSSYSLDYAALNKDADLERMPPSYSAFGN